MNYQRGFDKRLNVGLVGVGDHSYRNILTAMTHLPVKLTALCDLNTELLAATAAQYGVENTYASTADMYAQADLDAVFICVGPKLHPQLTIEALDAGLHVWLEKPPAMRAAEIQTMLDRRGDRIVIAGFKKVFMPVTAKARELIRLEDFGPLKSILAVYPMSLPEAGRHILDENTYTNWLGNGVHPLSMMMGIGGSVKAITAHRGENGGGAAVLEFSNGCLGNFHLAEGGGRGQPLERYMFFGDGRHIEIENNTRLTYQRGIPFEYSATSNFAPEGLDHGALVWEPQHTLGTLENKSLFLQGMVGEMRYFCDCILNSESPEHASLEFALQVMKVYEAGLLSSGRRIAIE